MDRRRDTDMGKLMNAGYTVEPINESIHRFLVHFNGPHDSLYSGGVWKVYVVLNENYPNKSPLLNFATPIYHPNILLMTGKICVNLLDAQRNPECELVSVFDLILPQLLREPNASDPLNTEAGKLLLENNTSAYEERVKECLESFAKPGQDNTEIEKNIISMSNIRHQHSSLLQ